MQLIVKFLAFDYRFVFHIELILLYLVWCRLTLIAVVEKSDFFKFKRK